jgi:isoamylase
MRRFIKGDHGHVSELATRLSGSSDLYQNHNGSPLNSINFVTCHDGFTLNDLFSYNKKHNLANGEHNADGTNDNFSFNCGAEGNTDKRDILRLRRRLAKNALACLMLSAGVPMINGGDEFLRTQKGNNNAYCQDSELSWFNWDLLEKNGEIFEFTRKLIAFRKKHAVLRRDMFFAGIDESTGNFDIRWLNENLAQPDWNDYRSRLLCCELDCNGYFLFFIFNAYAGKKTIALPVRKNFYWRRIMDTGVSHGDNFFDSANEPVLTENNYSIRPMSIAVLEGITI